MKKPFKHFTGYYYTALADKVPTIAERPRQPYVVDIAEWMLAGCKVHKRNYGIANFQ